MIIVLILFLVIWLLFALWVFNIFPVSTKIDFNDESVKTKIFRKIVYQFVKERIISDQITVDERQHFETKQNASNDSIQSIQNAVKVSPDELTYKVEVKILSRKGEKSDATLEVKFDQTRQPIIMFKQVIYGSNSETEHSIFYSSVFGEIELFETRPSIKTLVLIFKPSGKIRSLFDAIHYIRVPAKAYVSFGQIAANVGLL